ncbi:MAG: L-threonine 3-dehydrogenase [Fimbriimonadaceae bacterium]|nr:L-threonine 3-dehydrogenase [Fimbriimonadaceae bacterium]
MKAIAKTRPEPGLEIISVPEPTLKPGHVLLRVERGSVCGTDLHIFNWDGWSQGRIHPPRIIGHEFCGTIVEVAADVTERKVGDFVASESHIIDPQSSMYLSGLGHVDRTTTILGVDVDGGFAPYAVIPVLNARPVPASVPKSVASMLDALGNAVHTVMDGPVEGRTILITGLGPIGLFSVAICRALGARKIIGTEISPYRIALAEQLGIDIVLNPAKQNVSEELAQIAPNGVDATLEMSGHPSSIPLAIRHTAAAGRLSLLGVFANFLDQVDLNEVIFKGLQLHGIVGRKMWETWDQMEWLLTEKGLDVTPVVTHEYPWDEIEPAMQILRQGQAGKIVLDFTHTV